MAEGHVLTAGLHDALPRWHAPSKCGLTKKGIPMSVAQSPCTITKSGRTQKPSWTGVRTRRVRPVSCVVARSRCLRPDSLPASACVSRSAVLDDDHGCGSSPSAARNDPFSRLHGGAHDDCQPCMSVYRFANAHSLLLRRTCSASERVAPPPIALTPFAPTNCAPVRIRNVVQRHFERESNTGVNFLFARRKTVPII